MPFFSHKLSPNSFFFLSLKLADEIIMRPDAPVNYRGVLAGINSTFGTLYNLIDEILRTLFTGNYWCFFYVILIINFWYLVRHV